MRVGITGQSGFIGQNLLAFVNSCGGFQTVPFEDAFFGNRALLMDFVGRCDVVVHLAGVTRHPDEKFLYEVNVGLCRQLVDAMQAVCVRPQVLFASSVFEDSDTPYGRAKRDGRLLLEKWAKENGGDFVGCVFPNIFGPGSKPFYCSFVANFAYQLTHGETPIVLVDREIKLKYVRNLCKWMCGQMGVPGVRRVEVPPDFVMKVSDVLSLMRRFGEADGIPSSLCGDENVKNLFETYKYFQQLPTIKR